MINDFGGLGRRRYELDEDARRVGVLLEKTKGKRV
ncbi:hypothetical protein WG66_006545, partial [Moniliophthora roreri]